MPFASTHSIAIRGAQGHLVDVQADVSTGKAGISVVGRGDLSVSQAPQRCQMAILNSGLEWPSSRRVTILFSPADLDKRGTHFDLSTALVVLAATGQVAPASLADTVFVGELTLGGGLREVAGVLPMAIASRERGIGRLVCPETQVREAAMVPGLEVIGIRSLGQAVALVQGDPMPQAAPVAAMSGGSLLAWRGEDRLDDVDLCDLAGMADAKYAAEVAAAGGHHLLLSGPKGSGKTSLAERIPGLLPDLDIDEALEVTSLHSLAGALPGDGTLLERPPFSAPHHDATKASIIGGGTGRVRPGEVSRAHCGVLFLDEFPLLRTDVIDSLRQPLETAEVTVARGDETVRYPARGMVVFAANPCPCGNWHTDRAVDQCSCTANQRRDYQARVRGPITDRIDITRHLVPATVEAHDPLAVRESSAQVRARVTLARERQADRYAERPWRLNGQAPGAALARDFPLEDEGRRLLQGLVVGGSLTQRGAVRVHRLAWTIADLTGVVTPGVEEVEIAVSLRRGDPLPSRALRRVAS